MTEPVVEGVVLWGERDRLPSTTGQVRLEVSVDGATTTSEERGVPIVVEHIGDFHQQENVDLPVLVQTDHRGPWVVPTSLVPS